LIDVCSLPLSGDEPKLDGDAETGPPTRPGVVEGRTGAAYPTGGALGRRGNQPGGGDFVFRAGFKMPRTLHIPAELIERLSTMRLEGNDDGLGVPGTVTLPGPSIATLSSADVLRKGDGGHSRPRTAPLPRIA
jgi:hypothetical protein